MSADESARPLLDPVVLEKLRSDFDGHEEIWQVFARNFINALPWTIDKLRLALTTGDLMGAIDAALSLKTESQQVGALRLATLTHGLEMAIREGVRDRDSVNVLPWLAADYLPRIVQRARQTSYLLIKGLTQSPVAGHGSDELTLSSLGTLGP